MSKPVKEMSDYALRVEWLYLARLRGRWTPQEALRWEEIDREYQRRAAKR